MSCSSGGSATDVPRQELIEKGTGRRGTSRFLAPFVVVGEARREVGPTHIRYDKAMEVVTLN
jgi:hypothetical protein